MGLLGKSPVEKILDARRAYDRGEASADDLIAVVRDSRATDINEAMDAYGDGTESRSRIKGSR